MTWKGVSVSLTEVLTSMFYKGYKVRLPFEKTEIDIVSVWSREGVCGGITDLGRVLEEP